MVTFSQVYDVKTGQSVPIKTEGCFVLPITWLYVMLQANQIKIDDALLDKGNFTEEMLLNLIIDFKSMSNKQFFNSRFSNISFAVCQWNTDKQWIAYKAEDNSYHDIIMRNENLHIRNVCMEAYVDKEGRNKLKWTEHTNICFDNVDTARYFLRFSKVLSKFSKNVHFLGEHDCSQTIILS